MSALTKCQSMEKSENLLSGKIKHVVFNKSVCGIKIKVRIMRDKKAICGLSCTVDVYIFSYTFENYE